MAEGCKIWHTGSPQLCENFKAMTHLVTEI